jgi:hypothetical protein
MFVESNNYDPMIQISSKRRKLNASEEKTESTVSELFSHFEVQIKERTFHVSRLLISQHSAFFSQAEESLVKLDTIEEKLFEKIQEFVERGILEVKGWKVSEMYQLVAAAKFLTMPQLEEKCFDELLNLLNKKPEFKEKSEVLTKLLPWLDGHSEKVRKTLESYIEGTNQAPFGLALKINERCKLDVSLSGTLKSQGAHFLKNTPAAYIQRFDLSNFPCFYRPVSEPLKSKHIARITHLLVRTEAEVVFESDVLFQGKDIKELIPFSKFLTSITLKHRVKQIQEDLLCECLKQSKRLRLFSIASCSVKVHEAVKELFKENATLEFFVGDGKVIL